MQYNPRIKDYSHLNMVLLSGIIGFLSNNINENKEIGRTWDFSENHWGEDVQNSQEKNIINEMCIFTMCILACSPDKCAIELSYVC